MSLVGVGGWVFFEVHKHVSSWVVIKTSFEGTTTMSQQEPAG